MKKLIIYELNEVSPKILRTFNKLYPSSCIANICTKHKYCITTNNNHGELHPWSTWPTVHRGVINTEHGINYINQDLTEPNRKHPPIWHSLVDNNNTIGIFGSLQSYPPMKGNMVNFFVPDTFAPEPECYPSSLDEFQRFNLTMAGKNKAKSGRLTTRDARKFLKLVFNGSISLSCTAKIIMHVAREKINPIWKTRRPLLQPLIGFEVYYKLLTKKQPDFSTFFTNHVAAMMHRYWAYLYPQENTSNSNKDEVLNKFNSNSIIEAMLIADKQISKLLNYAKRTDTNLWIISSMGQDAIKDEEYIKETFLHDWKRLIIRLGLDINMYALVPAMQPDICFQCENKNALIELKSALKSLQDWEKNEIFSQSYSSGGLTISYRLTTNKCIASLKPIIYKNESLTLTELGLSLISRDKLTAYHIPEGIFLAAGPDESIIKDRKTIEATEIHSQILNLYNIVKQ